MYCCLQSFDQQQGPLHTMTFDKGATTFDLQDTEFYDKYELFDHIRRSHIRHRPERTLWEDWNEHLKDSINQHHTQGE